MEKKQVTIEDAVTESKEKAEKYFYAVGKRKTAIAQVRIYPTKKPVEMLINDKKATKYFSVATSVDLTKAPFLITGAEDKFNVTVRVAGGGINAQMEAIRLGISRALIKFDETLRKSLKSNGLLTRDSRVVERKKPGLKKARRAPQWAKR
ncbi:MAG: 30S ribosomal protein S9 [Candidatus Moraniibacteriota bacterium]